MHRFTPLGLGRRPALAGGFGDRLLKLLYDHVLGLLGIG